MTEARPERTTGAATGTARPEGTEGRTPPVEATTAVGAAFAAALSTMSTLVSVGTHRNHSIQSLICRDASTIYRNLSQSKPPFRFPSPDG